MKLNRIGSFVIIACALALILSQNASVAVKAQVSGFSASLSQQPTSKAKSQRPNDQAPYKITVQGRLTDPSGNPITSAVNVSFNLYSVPTGGSPIFSEGPVSVTPDNRGLLTYQLGSTSVISTALVSQFAGSLYLGLTVGSDAEMAPRILLTASPYAMSLAPGAVVSGALDTSDNTTNFGVINGVNLDASSVNNAGLYGKGATGVYGEADPSRGFGSYAGYFVNPGGFASSQFGIDAQISSIGGNDGYAGYFYNSGGGSGSQYGTYATAGASGNPAESSIGVVGTSSDPTNGVGGVFTGTNAGGIFYSASPAGIALRATGMSSSGASAGGNAIKGQGGDSAGGNGGTGVEGDGGLTNNGASAGGAGVIAQGGAGNNGAYGGPGIIAAAGVGTNQGVNIAFDAFFPSTDSNFTGVYATGHMEAKAFDTHTGYDLVVEYHGSAALHAGDVLAFDGNNRTVHGATLLGVVKATAQNADMAMGVAQQRMIWQQDQQSISKSGQTIDPSGWHLDSNSAAFQPGDVLSVMVLGQVQEKVSGANFGDKLTLDPSGNLAAAKGADNIIGKVVSQPDKNGYVTVFVNLK